MNLFGNTDFLSKALDVSSLRNQLITNNIANVDTPGYKRKEVDFQSYLQDALRSNSDGNQDTARVRNQAPRVFDENSNYSTRSDDNNVDIELEMSYLAQNSIQYNTLISQVNYNFNRLKMVMNR